MIIRRKENTEEMMNKMREIFKKNDRAYFCNCDCYSFEDEFLVKLIKIQTLLGVTGSGKTLTMANIIEKVQKSTLVLAHNKTLAGQLYSEFKEFFPENAVEYFVSYYEKTSNPVLFSAV